jgi:hypothetical protein
VCWRLDIVQPGKAPPRKRRRVVRRNVDESILESQLKTERMEDNPAFAIVVGEQMVCCDGVISDICSNAKFKDMDLFSFRTELRERFFNALSSVSTNFNVQGSPSIRDVLTRKHPPGRSAHVNCIVPSVPTEMHPVIFDSIDASAIRSAALRVTGSAWS